MPPSEPSVITEPSAAGPRADRIVAAGAQDILERLQGSALLEAGAVNIIGLDAIRRKLGERWPNKRSQIWEHVEREFERSLSPADMFFRADDVSYMVAQPGSTGFAAQGVCLTILQDVLRFFMGESRFADIDVRVVSSITGAQVLSAPVDLGKLRRAAPPTDAAIVITGPEPAAAKPAAAPTGPTINAPLADHGPPEPPWQPPLAGRTSVVDLATSKGGGFDLKLSVDGVWNLRRGLITSFLIERGGVGTRTEPAELEEIDVATFAYAAVLLEEQTHQGGPLTLHLPVSFTSLATLRTRARLMALTQSVREAMRRTVLLEICGLDAGVPPSRLVEVVGLVRSLCAGVIGRVRPSKSALAAARGCGLRGVAVEAEFLGPNKPELDARLKAFAATAKDISPNLLIHGLPDLKLIDAAAAAGFSHASAMADL